MTGAVSRTPTVPVGTAAQEWALYAKRNRAAWFDYDRRMTALRASNARPET